MTAIRKSAVIAASTLAVLTLTASSAGGDENLLAAVWSWLVRPVSPDLNVPRGTAICIAVIGALVAVWLLAEWKHARRREGKRAPNETSCGSDDGERVGAVSMPAPAAAGIVTCTRECPDDVEDRRPSDARVASTNVIPGVVEDDAGQTQVIAACDVDLETEALVGTEVLGTAGLLAGLGSDGGAFTRSFADFPRERDDVPVQRSAGLDAEAPADEFECTQVLSAPSPCVESEFECTQVLSAPDNDLECTQVLLSPLGKSGSPEDADRDRELVGELEELMGKRLV